MKSVTLLTKMHDLRVTAPRGDGFPGQATIIRTGVIVQDAGSNVHSSGHQTALPVWKRPGSGVRILWPGITKSTGIAVSGLSHPTSGIKGDDKAPAGETGCLYQAARAQHPARWRARLRGLDTYRCRDVNPERPEKPEPSKRGCLKQLCATTILKT